MKKQDTFSEAAGEAVMRGAASFVRVQGFTPTDEQYEALTAQMRIAAREALPKALEDAREALAANMDSVAAATFESSMRLAGIEAAKAVLT